MRTYLKYCIFIVSVGLSACNTVRADLLNAELEAFGEELLSEDHGVIPSFDSNIRSIAMSDNSIRCLEPCQELLIAGVMDTYISYINPKNESPNVNILGGAFSFQNKKDCPVISRDSLRHSRFEYYLKQQAAIGRCLVVENRKISDADVIFSKRWLAQESISANEGIRNRVGVTPWFKSYRYIVMMKDIGELEHKEIYRLTEWRFFKLVNRSLRGIRRSAQGVYGKTGNFSQGNWFVSKYFKYQKPKLPNRSDISQTGFDLIKKIERTKRQPTGAEWSFLRGFFWQIEGITFEEIYTVLENRKFPVPDFRIQRIAERSDTSPDYERLAKAIVRRLQDDKPGPMLKSVPRTQTRFLHELFEWLPEDVTRDYHEEIVESLVKAFSEDLDYFDAAFRLCQYKSKGVDILSPLRVNIKSNRVNFSNPNKQIKNLQRFGLQKEWLRKELASEIDSQRLNQYLTQKSISVCG